MSLDLTMNIPVTDMALLIDLLKPSQWETVLAATIPAYISMFGTFYLYYQERKDKLKDNKKTKDEEQIKDLNILLANLFQCIENQKDNLNEVIEYKKETEKTFGERQIFVFKDDTNIEEILRIANKIIVDLPEVSYDLNRLKNDLYWAKRYRDSRDNYSHKYGYKFYTERLDREEEQETMIIKRLIAICLVLYDYATSLYPKKRILKITAKAHVSTIWKYLINDETFNETAVFSRLQYEFKNAAIRDWFFIKLKNEYIKFAKNEPLLKVLGH
ncbi:MAG: hypothetical protein IKN73_04070 [Alphaproteobacteria bacterium]|nr:hypothetical protein [Alphaproteobacteria bacterium]